MFIVIDPQGKKLVLTGHSLGGCVAGLAALRLLNAIHRSGEGALEDVYCVTLAVRPTSMSDDIQRNAGSPPRPILKRSHPTIDFQ